MCYSIRGDSASLKYKERNVLPMNLQDKIAIAMLVVEFIGLVLQIIDYLRHRKDRS